jgi:hypothetical protein
VLTKRAVRDDFTDAVAKRLEYGDRVYVIGNAERDASGAMVIRPAARPAWSEMLWKTLFGAVKPPRGRDTHDVFFLTDGSEKDAKAHILQGFRTVLLWGLLWIAASAMIIWTSQQPWRLAPPPDSWRNAFWRGPEPNPDTNVRDYARNQRLFRFEKYIKSVTKTSYQEIPALIEAVGYRDYRFYTPATWALVRMMPRAREQAKAALPGMIGRLDLCIRNAESLQTMIIAVGRFGPDAAPAVPKLIEALRCQKTNTYVVSPNIIRYQAARALGEIGPAAKDAVPALREAMNDPSAGVRKSAEQALWLITGRNEAAEQTSEEPQLDNPPQ